MSEFSLPDNDESISLSSEEALTLANELSEELHGGAISCADSRLIRKITAGLGDQRGRLRLTFTKSLASIGDAALPSLYRILHHHHNVTARRAAAKTLNLISNPDALPYLLKAFMEDEDPVVQGSSAGAMASIGPGAVDIFLGILVDPNCTPFQIGLANLGLSFIGAKAPQALRKAARSEHVEIRVAAISALGDQIQSLKDDEAKTILIEALDDPYPEVRSEAVTLFGRLYDSAEASPLLIRKLRDKEAQVRKNAAFSLMKLGVTSSIQPLKEAQNLEDMMDVSIIFQLAINQLEKLSELDIIS
ncbi:glycosyltransferase [cyanobiont of Ornithocercus magnificus]|nr:glycosyltransferase [cyanobiont of Ornithocercus magnificus]